MRARDKDRLGILRLIAAGVKQKEVDERITLDDSQIIAIIDKMIKQQRDALTQFESAGRTDLVNKSNFELGIMQTYMPALLSAAELSTIITQSIIESGAKSPADMGKVMGLLKLKVQGRCDMGNLSKQVKEKLSQFG